MKYLAKIIKSLSAVNGLFTLILPDGESFSATSKADLKAMVVDYLECC